MFIWASIAKHAKRASLTRVLCVFFGLVSLLTVPVGISILGDPPHVFYPRMHGGPDWDTFDRSWVDDIYVVEDERGFIEGVYWVTFDEYELQILPMMIHLSEVRRPLSVLSYEQAYLGHVSFIPHYDFPTSVTNAAYHFIFSPEYIFFRDATSSLVIPTHMVSAWALREVNLEEIFDHLALYNRYFSSIVAPMFIFLFATFLFSNAAIMLAAVWLFGWWQKTAGFLNWRERLAVCVFASIPAALIAFAIGLFFPIVHAFLFQFIMLYFAYKTLKEYFNEGSGWLAREVI